MKFKDLNHKHPEYDADRILRYDLLYEGGEAILKEAKRFIHREPHESADAYETRLKWASYNNYFAQIVDSYVADLFSKPMMVTSDEAPQESGQVASGSMPKTNLQPFYEAFLEDSDLRGNCLEQVLREPWSEALEHSCAYLGVDFPKPASIPVSLKDEEESGADRAYVFYIENESVIDWEMDDRGEYRWIVLKTETSPKDSPFEARDKRIISFKVWQRIEGQVSFQIWQVVTKIDDEPSDEAELTLVDGGDVSFKRIPVLRIQLEEELQLGRLLAAPCIDLFRRRSALLFAQNRSLYAVLVYKQGPELAQDGSLSEASMNPGRGNNSVATAKARGGVVIGAEDEVSFVEPVGGAFNIAHEGIKDDVDELHRVTHTMAMSISNTETALGRSGASKMQDNKAKEIVLSAYAEVFKDFVKKLMVTISEGRNESIDWKILGMDSYRVVDRELLLTEAKEIASIEIPSKTFNQHRLVRLAKDLEEDLPPETMLLVKQEIEAEIASGWKPMPHQQAEADIAQVNVASQTKAPAPKTKQKVRK